MNLEQMWSAGNPKQHDILNVRTKIAGERTRLQRFVDDLGNILTNPGVPLILLAFQLLWIFFNTGVSPCENPDPFPFAFLSTLTSGIGPVLTLLVIIYQNRDQRVQELREEITLHFMVRLEQEVTMSLRLMRETQKQLNLQTRQNEEVLYNMEQSTDPSEILKSIRSVLRSGGENRSGTGV